MAKPDWSKIGKASRAKGKVFERIVRRWLAQVWPGGEWLTTRNSGRTDIKGDVFNADHDIMVECKDRKTWTKERLWMGQMQNEINEILDEWLEDSPNLQLIIVFRESKFVWVTGFWRLKPSDNFKTDRVLSLGYTESEIQILKRLGKDVEVHWHKYRAY